MGLPEDLIDQPVSRWESEDFLDLVWGDYTDGWIDMPSKLNHNWIHWPHEWDGECDLRITNRIDYVANDNDGEDLYFSCGVFDQRGRKDEFLRPPWWLWADLDEVHPSVCSKDSILPTLAWESSPGRYQAMWRLNKPIGLGSFDKVNQALSYHLGADHGGWDRTQVLRLPGTRNWKYEGSPQVKLLWYHREVSYSGPYIWSVVRNSIPAGGMSATGAVPDGKARAMPAMARALLRVRPENVVEGERSSRLWQLECLLAEAGWNEDSIYAAVVGSAWNKWKDVGTGESRLRTEIRKAIRHAIRRAKPAVVKKPARAKVQVTDRRGSDSPTASDEVDLTETETVELPWVQYDAFMSRPMEDPKWLIENLWCAGSQGILGGEPKTSKTTVALAMAVAVASGENFLGREEFPVGDAGPVLLVQEENSPWMIQDRLKKLAWLSGLIPREVITKREVVGGISREVFDIEFPRDIPLKVLNNFGVDLTFEAHRDAIERELAAYKPKLLILDPLYMLFAGVNFDKAHELSPYLRWLTRMSNEYKCAVMIIHHFRKYQAQTWGYARPGQRLMGNATLHGFIDSAIYTEQSRMTKASSDGMLYTTVEREFRSVEPKKAIELGLKLGRPGRLKMEVDLSMHDLQGMIENLIMEHPGIAINDIAKTFDRDRRDILTRVNGSNRVELKLGGRGRGNTTKAYPVGFRNGNEN